MFRESKQGRRLFIYIIFCSVCFGISNAYRDYVIGEGTDYIQNFFIVLLIAVLFALEIYFCTVFKEGNNSLSVNILYNAVCTLSLATVAYIYSKLVHVVGDNQDFFSATQYWLIVGIILILVILATLIADFMKKKDS